MTSFSTRGTLHHWFENLSSALTSGCFPGVCRFCDQFLTDARRLSLCFVPENSSGGCDPCGLPGTFDPEFPKELSFCRDCQQRRFAFELVVQKEAKRLKLPYIARFFDAFPAPPREASPP
jgi:hypothetical protein